MHKEQKQSWEKKLLEVWRRITLAQPICWSLIKVVRYREDNTTPRWSLIGHLDPESRELGEGAVHRIGEEIEKRKGGKKDWGERLQESDFLSLLAHVCLLEPNRNCLTNTSCRLYLFENFNTGLVTYSTSSSNQISVWVINLPSSVYHETWYPIVILKKNNKFIVIKLPWTDF